MKEIGFPDGVYDAILFRKSVPECGVQWTNGVATHKPRLMEPIVCTGMFSVVSRHIEPTCATRSSILVLSDDDVLGRIASEGGCVDRPCLFLHFCGLGSRFIWAFFIAKARSK
jgi:hypothetical protein